MLIHEMRVLHEKAALDKKIAALSAFTNPQNALFASLDASERALLCMQHDVMRQYSNILSQRIEKFETGRLASLLPQYSADISMLAEMTQTEQDQFIQWFSELESENLEYGEQAATYTPPLVKSTGMKHWITYFDEGMTPAESLKADIHHAYETGNRAELVGMAVQGLLSSAGNWHDEDRIAGLAISVCDKVVLKLRENGGKP